ncbi:RNA polymerase sigma factor [Streptomyces sp. NPDC058700]|uniref:RNA polymerase sigma factor n=1 Tax=unclassified Streptomyces TaxID=2593676 RepID=UPI00364F4B1E
MVDGEASAEPSVSAVLEQRLLDSYPMFMATEPRILWKKTQQVLSEHACQDIAQEAFERVVEKVRAGALGAGVNLPAYLRAATRNLAWDVLRAAKRHGALPLYDSGLLSSVPLQRVPVDDVDPLEELVVPAIDAMPRTRRRKVVQLQSQGLEDAEIAKALGIEPGRLHKDRHTAVSELRSELGKHIREGHRKQMTRRVKKDR